MKPKTKKTLIIVTALVIVSIVIYFVFCRPGWKKELDKLSLSRAEKKGIAAEVKAILADPEYDKATLETHAQNSGMTYDQWLVALAAMGLGYDAEATNGTLTIFKPQH